MHVKSALVCCYCQAFDRSYCGECFTEMLMCPTGLDNAAAVAHGRQDGECAPLCRAAREKGSGMAAKLLGVLQICGRRGCNRSLHALELARYGVLLIACCLAQHLGQQAACGSTDIPWICKQLFDRVLQEAWCMRTWFDNTSAAWHKQPVMLRGSPHDMCIIEVSGFSGVRLSRLAVAVTHPSRRGRRSPRAAPRCSCEAGTTDPQGRMPCHRSQVLVLC